MGDTDTAGTHIAYGWAKTHNIDADRIVEIADLAKRIDRAIEAELRSDVLKRAGRISPRNAALLQAAAVIAAGDTGMFSASFYIERAVSLLDAIESWEAGA